MPELRRDAIVNRWVIVAENRAQRPGALAATIPRDTAHLGEVPASSSRNQSGAAANSCPFCPGNEHETPPATFALRDDAGHPDQPGWRVRIVSNKYPALATTVLQANEPLTGTFRTSNDVSLFSTLEATGVHEVIIDTARHITTVGELTELEFAESLTAIHSRLGSLRGQPGLGHALVFKNVGHAAGATREHLHSQLMATEMTVSLVQEELDGAKRFFDEHRRCVFCRMIDEERTRAQRVVCESRSFIAICPYASRFPYEMWVLPKQHNSQFERATVEDLADLARLARGVIAKIERLSQPPAYNLVFHSGPFDSLAMEHYHWHIEIFPRLTIPAGFEWGSGWAVNPVSPETAATILSAIGK